MNILMVGDTLPQDKPGGNGTYLWEVGQRLARSGHQVFILVERHVSTSPVYENLEGIHIYRFGNHQDNLLVSLITRFRASRRIFETLTENIDFDLINIHFALGGFGILRSPKSQPMPCIFTFHGPWPRESLIEDRKRLQDKEGLAKLVYAGRTRLSFWIKIRIERKVVQSTDRFLVSSQFSKKLLIETHNVAEKDINIISGAVDTVRFHPLKDKNKAKAALGLPPGPPIILTVRRIVSRMGLENLIEAMRIVLQKHQAVLVIGGTGYLKSQLEALVYKYGLEEYIKLVGHIPDDQLSLYYQAADLFVLPSLSCEGFGLVTLEALSSGVPVLGRAVGGTIEILEKLDPSLLVFEGEADALAKAVVTALERKFVPGHLRQFAEDNYSWNKIFPQIEEVLANTAHNIP